MIDRLSEQLGRALLWLPIAMAVITVLVVVLRYGFGIGTIGAQESVIYLHSILFMLGASVTLCREGHVRVDVFYRHFSRRGQAWVNALGHITCTLPLCAVIAIGSWDYVQEAWRIKESSPEPGGIPAIFLLKSLLPIMAGLLALQAVSELLKALHLLRTQHA